MTSPVASSYVIACQTSPPPIFQEPSPCQVFAAISSSFVSKGFEGSPGTVQKRQTSPAALGVVGGQRAADSVVGAVVPHKNFPLGNARGAGDAGLRGLANGGFPDFAR